METVAFAAIFWILTGLFMALPSLALPHPRTLSLLTANSTAPLVMMRLAGPGLSTLTDPDRTLSGQVDFEGLSRPWWRVRPARKGPSGETSRRLRPVQQTACSASGERGPILPE